MKYLNVLLLVAAFFLMQNGEVCGMGLFGHKYQGDVAAINLTSEKFKAYTQRHLGIHPAFSVSGTAVCMSNSRKLIHEQSARVEAMKSVLEAELEKQQKLNETFKSNESQYKQDIKTSNENWAFRYKIASVLTGITGLGLFSYSVKNNTVSASTVSGVTGTLIGAAFGFAAYQKNNQTADEYLNEVFQAESAKLTGQQKKFQDNKALIDLVAQAQKEQLQKINSMISVD